MTDAHLQNTIRMLERSAQTRYPKLLRDAYSLENFVSAEIASMDAARIVQEVEDGGWEELLPEIYFSLKQEVTRREALKIVCSDDTSGVGIRTGTR